MSDDERPVSEDDVQALVDGRLTAQRRAFVEAYVDAHPDLRAHVDADISIAAQLRARLDAGLEAPIPARLRIANIRARRRGRQLANLRRLAASLALVVAGAGIGWAGNSWMQARRPVLANSFAAAFAAYRTFVPEKLHPVEVRAEAGSRLVTWLSNRVGRPLLVPDLSGEGFTLMGGRLLPAGQGEPAAMLMYVDDLGHRLTLYTRASSTRHSFGLHFQQQGSVAAYFWANRHLDYVVAASVNRPLLQSVAEDVNRQFNARL
ncbi:MAG: anti-sigma factor [Hyphomicrobiales bacterium]|nr:anti-sigma factor [Hyphomicrobiales bacterium]